MGVAGDATTPTNPDCSTITDQTGVTTVSADDLPAMHSDQAIASLRTARELLSEAIRYPSSDPDAAVEFANRARGHINALVGVGCRGRLWNNLGSAIDAIRVDHDVFRSYCYATAYELLRIGGWQLCRTDQGEHE